MLPLGPGMLKTASCVAGVTRSLFQQVNVLITCYFCITSRDVSYAANFDDLIVLMACLILQCYK